LQSVAVGGHLERLVSLGIQPQTHYWITDRRDAATDTWAERNNIRIIRYKPSSTEHPELIELLDELASYVQPEEEPSPPVALELDFGNEPIAPPNMLVTLPAERIRSDLNRYASRLLKDGDENAYLSYEKFSKEYDRAIHAAWYTSTDSGENDFLGYKLKEEIARGAFGIVFRAVNGSGDEFAIKVLHAEIRKKAELLNAFRRGVRSMRILGEKNVDGMVRYHAASEIPATLIMDWVEGPNLNQVVESGTLDDWERILDIGRQLAEIIASAHALPERVLHRDIRPPNMIISGYWDGEEPLKVKVLDFDLSWHRGSVEKSVIFGSQLSGYLAPEQVQRRVGVSTQHASVDSYGLGMTLFYMVAARNPVPGEHAHSSWRDTLDAVSRRPRGTEWKSLARRVARLIYFATQERQEKRWDVVQIRSELRRLYEAHSSARDVHSAELLAEEIAARCALLKDYVWNDEKFSVEHNFGTGLSVSLRGDESSQEVNLVLTRIATEATDRNRLGDSICRARDLVRSALTNAGWGVYADVGQGMLTVRASISCSEIAGKLDQTVDSVRRAIERTTFG
jgi:eukaryotic-like serine/threonine-protein kinase